MLLQVENNLDQQPSTLNSFLSTNLVTGGTTVPVKNINSFTNQWAVQLGRTGEEQSEILTISGAPSGTALNTAGTVRFAHPIDTPIYQIHYDSVIFLRSTTGTTGTASALATVSIKPDSFYTEYNDSTGATTYAYQSQYYNSVSGDLSGTSPWFIPGGPTFYSLQKLRERAKHDLFSSNYIRDDMTIHDWINEWVEFMTNSALKVNQGYALGTAAYAYGTAGIGTVTEPLFKYAAKIEVGDGTNLTRSTEIPVNQFSRGDFFNALSPRHAWIGDTTFQILPYGNAGTAYMTLGQLSTQLVEDTDELPQFLKPYTTGCIEYVLYKAYDLDQKDTVADKHYAKVLNAKRDFINEITPRDQTGVKMIDMVDSLTGDDGYFIDSDVIL